MPAKRTKRTWSDYYQNHQAPLSNLLLHAEYLGRVLIRRPKTLLEIGCGPADHSLFIKKLCPGMQLYLVDSDRALLDTVTRQHGAKIANAFHVNVLNRGAVAGLPKVDLTVSQGLLEHFADADLARVIANFAPVTKRMLHSVPADTYQHQDFGNEVLRSQAELNEFLERVCPYQFKVRRAFDPGIRTKRLLIQENGYRGWQALRFLLFGSCHLLIDVDYTKPRASSGT